MHHRTVERLAALESPVHRLDPRVKLLCTLVFVVAVALLPARLQAGYAVAAGMVVAGLLAARLPWGFVLSRLLRLLPFVVLVGIFWPFSRGREVVGRIDALGLTVYREGLVFGLALLLKGTLAILAVGWLVFSTPFHRLLSALRALRVPQVVVATLLFLFRYLDLLADESERVRRARAARSPGRTVRWRGRSTGGLIGRLFVRALHRAERIHRAMLARGFDGEVRVLQALRLRKADLIFGAGFVVALGAVCTMATWPWGA
jgi:cobalt/nickel transport system permease protein